MKTRRLLYLLALSGGTFLAACNSNPKPVTHVEPVAKAPEVMEPFRYHKLVEVSPGQDYDVVSWGRGATKTGAFAILHSDSADARFTSTTGDLVGTIVDVFNTDMDLDGNPEIIIQTKGIDTLNYTTMYAFEFSNSHAEKLDFPRLSKDQRNGYRGEDNFYVKDGKLYREFPLFDGSAKATGQKRELEYGMRDNSLTVKQVSQDTAGSSTIVKPAPKPKHEKEKSEKHSPESRHRKKHHHHRKEE
jgi:hypothetical protein